MFFFFFRDTPTNYDHEIFDAISNVNIETNKYPWIYRWLYSMKDYNNINNL